LLKVALTIISPNPKLTKKEKMVWRYKEGNQKSSIRNLKSNWNHGIILRPSGRVGSSCYACDTRLSFSCKMTWTSSDMVIALHNYILK
jgi:hypothetical protein